MSKLQKFIEKSSSERTGRVAYAFGLAALPQPSEGMAWQPVASFNAADEVLKDQSLKTVFKAAIKDGCAVLAPSG